MRRSTLIVLPFILLGHAGCSDGGGQQGAPATTSSPSVEGLDACELLTVARVEELTGYATTATPSSPGPGGCLYDTADGDVGISVSIGADPGADSEKFLGVHREDGGNGVQVQIDDNYDAIVGLVYPDGSALSLSITGRARGTSTGDPASPIRDIFTTKGGEVLPIHELYAALISTIRAKVE